MSAPSHTRRPWRAATLVGAVVILAGIVGRSFIEESSLVHFTPAKVLGNPECLQSPGLGPSSDIALVLLPAPPGARFAAVDGTGILHTGALPFLATQYVVARRADGSVLTMFGRAEREDSRNDLRVFLDGQAILERHNIREFGLADDGSSFFVIEPLDGESSRLVIHNLDQSGERHYNLGNFYQKYGIEQMVQRWSENKVTYYVRYSINYAEVMFVPFPHRIGTHHFFSTAAEGPEPRRIDLKYDDGVTGSLFASSEVGYLSLGKRWSSEPVKIVRREFSWSSDGVHRDAWQRTLPRTSLWQLSTDGARMLMIGAKLQVLDSLSGETVFHVASADHDAASGIEEKSPTMRTAYLHENQLLMRTFASFSEETPKDAVIEIYDLDDPQPDGEPNRRVPLNDALQCEPGDFAHRGLQEHDRRLTFLTERG